MKPFRERNPIVVGLVSVAVLTVMMLFAFSLNRFTFIRRVHSVSADFADAAGLTSDNEVRVAGLKVGKVKSVTLAEPDSHGVSDRVHVVMEVSNGLHLGERTAFVFVPHLLPTDRGIYSTMHVAFMQPMSNDDLAAIYAETYANAPLVRVLPAGKMPELKTVVNTPYTEIGFQVLQGGRRAVIVSVIDNLLKGAASQAVQNFNRMCGYADTEGLA